MARRIQIFTRLLPEQAEALDEIGQEMIDTGAVTEKELTTKQGVNRSEVIRILLAKADRRLSD